MSDEFLRELTQLQQYAAGLRDLVAEAEAAAPRRAEGADHTGAVRAVLGADGLPESFRVDTHWNSTLRPDAFGGAVLEACQAAMGERMAAWIRRLDEDNWRDRADRLREGDTGTPSRHGTIPPAFRSPKPEVTPRRLDEITENMLEAFDHVGELSARSAQSRGATGTGTAGKGKLVITLSETGLVSCTAEPRWASTQTGARLMNALGEALAAARADLVSSRDTTEPTGSVDRLLAEALAALSNPERHVEP